MQNNIQSLLESVISDQNTSQMLQNAVSKISEHNNRPTDTSLNDRQKNIRNNIEMLSVLMPLIPEKNVKKAQLIIKLLEAAILISQIKEQSAD